MTIFLTSRAQPIGTDLVDISSGNESPGGTEFSATFLSVLWTAAVAYHFKIPVFALRIDIQSRKCILVRYLFVQIGPKTYYVLDGFAIIIDNHLNVLHNDNLIFGSRAVEAILCESPELSKLIVCNEKKTSFE